ncbi:MAG: class I SAM-dependent methyltransferase [Chromatiales bacterium]
MSAETMQLHKPNAYETSTEQALMERLLPLDNARILELGCGAVWTTRQLAERYPASRFIATEVDRVQHEKNLQLNLRNVDFRMEGAQAISEAENSIDIVWMLKSLHHVPAELMPAAMREIHRVLKPGGLAYFSEPVYTGSFNALMSLIHDEKKVRQLAFNAIKTEVSSGAFDLRQELFFEVPGTYTWDEFESRFLKVTHTKLDIDEARFEQIRSAFMAHMSADGAHFLKPHRVDLLIKPM